MTKKLYARRDPIKQGNYYTDHIMAITAEGLHSKADIAKELAYRDMRIVELEGMLRKKLDLIKCGIAANYGSGAYEHELYLEAKEVAYKE